ncbi:hypothetical protein Cni_G22880 [Canna indica]|uniref:CCHC-type domain-containing protein n=1 Tax=Canna indica TaxID=4628 RepID=A0AAQ3QN25_9LILI|nr:hypothetical protein Cni_G22880 [Canna indica]
MGTTRFAWYPLVMSVSSNSSLPLPSLPPSPPPCPPDPPDRSRRSSPFPRAASPSVSPTISSDPVQKPASWAQILRNRNPNSKSRVSSPILSKIQSTTSDKISFSTEQIQSWRQPWEKSLIGAASLILTDGPWTFRGDVLRLMPWKPLFRSRDELFTTALVWIRFHSLPLEFWNKASVFSIAQCFGKVLKIDDRSFTFERGLYIRACVEIDLALPICEGVWISVDESEFFQPIVYENLPVICFQCGVIGHHDLNCPILVNRSNSKPDALNSESSHSEVSPVNFVSSELPSSIDPLRNSVSEPTCGPWIQVQRQNHSRRSRRSARSPSGDNRARA